MPLTTALFAKESITMIRGLIAPILTPFDGNLNLDQSLYNDLAKLLLTTGVRGLAPFGTTGEALSVSHGERKAARPRRKLVRVGSSGAPAHITVTLL